MAMAVADPGGEGQIGPRSPLFRPFFFAFHPGGRSGKQTVPLPHNVNHAKKSTPKKKKKKSGGKKCVGAPPPPPPQLNEFFRPGADSRPSLFTNPGSATAME